VLGFLDDRIYLGIELIYFAVEQYILAQGCKKRKKNEKKKKDQQDCPWGQVERKALWKTMGPRRHQKAG